MKHKLIETANVKTANEKLNYLLTRPQQEMVGLGLIYGAPGTGKTRYAVRTAMDNGYMFIRLEASMTQRSFLIKLYETLQFMYRLSMPVKGSTSQIYSEVVEILTNTKNLVIFIDEIDYAFKHRNILGSIRDLVDQTLVTIVLFGMQDAKQQLLKLNAHYFDRCNAFAEFKPLSLEDTRNICLGASDVKMDDEVVRFVYNTSKGCARQIVKTVDWLERKARLTNKSTITIADVK